MTDLSIDSIRSQQWLDKEDEIRSTLACGQDGSVVNLWHLRELALQPHGLCCPMLRKMAWPKLLACHEQLFLPQDEALEGANKVVRPSSQDIAAMKHQVAKTIWNVEAFLRASPRRLQQADDHQSKRVTFLMPTKEESKTAEDDAMSVERGADDDTNPPETVAASPASEDRNDVEKRARFDDGGDGGSITSNLSATAVFNNVSSSNSREMGTRTPTPQEQRIISNIVLSILRQEASPHESFEDDRYHFYSGLQDLCALMAINLESPSLTSLLVGKLAASHLRDAMRDDRSTLDTAISHSLAPLLEEVDRGLFNHLHGQGTSFPTFSRQWISCWFAQDVPDAEVGSRLLDVFLVSHPMMPIYIAAAFLKHNRLAILHHDPQNAKIHTFLRRLPFQTLSDKDAGRRMEKTEEIITMALRFMKKVPPNDLVGKVKEQIPLVFPAIAMFQGAPEWLLIGEAPSDYALLRRAHALRKRKGRLSSFFDKKIKDAQKVIAPAHYPLAAIAVGWTNRWGKRAQVGFIAAFSTLMTLWSVWMFMGFLDPSWSPWQHLSGAVLVPSPDGHPSTILRFQGKKKLTPVPSVKSRKVVQKAEQRVEATMAPKKASVIPKSPRPVTFAKAPTAKNQTKRAEVLATVHHQLKQLHGFWQHALEESIETCLE